MLIGLVGFIGAGKGTVADLLCNNYKFHKLSFADSVKDATAAMFGWERHMLEGDTEESRSFREQPDDWWSKRLGMEFTPRYAMQVIGTEAGREVLHPDMWIMTLERKLKNYKNVVIPDTRFPNEIQFIRDNGGHIVRVRRGPEPVWYDKAYEAWKQGNDYIMTMDEQGKDVHYSEWAWVGEKLDFEISNQGSIVQLEMILKHCLKVFTGPEAVDKFVQN